MLNSSEGSRKFFTICTKIVSPLLGNPFTKSNPLKISLLLSLSPQSSYTATSIIFTIIVFFPKLPQMKQTNFISSLIHHHYHLTTLFFFFFFFFLPKTCQSIDDQQYLDCGVPQTCGGQIISYPFYIDQHKSHCGFPGFDLSCNSNKQPIINLSNNSYVVHNIFYGNQSIRISNAEFLSNKPDSTNCFPIPIRNLTLYGNRFDFALNNTNLFVWSNCSSNLTEHEVVSCSDDDGDGGKLAMILESEPNFGHVSRNCMNGVEVPVELDGEIGEDWEYYERLLRRGFLLKWNASDCSVCQQSGGRCGFHCATKSKEHVSGGCYNCYHKGSQCPDHMQEGFNCQNANKGDKRRALKLGLGIGGASTLVIAIVIFIIIWCHYKRNKYASSEYLSRNTSSDPCSKSYQDRGNVYFGVPIFSYCELEEATHNFDPNKELGDGSFGTVYHGILRDGREVAVKRLYENNSKRVDQFKNEIEILNRLRHKNLVTLYGCTSCHSRELLLVYEYIPNGTVADHLHGDRGKPCSFTWPIRLSIAIETASALAYLHASDIIHRDVKTSNILIDNNFCVKVADFGLSRLFPTNITHASTAPQGTPGYVDPQYHHCYQLTYKSDVYSFGVVLVELLSSLPAMDIRRHRHEINLANLAISRIQKCAYDELIDSSLGFNSDTTIKRMITSVAELAFQCLQNDKEMRPTMDEVLETLKGIESGRNNEMEVVEEEVDTIRPLPF